MRRLDDRLFGRGEPVSEQNFERLLIEINDAGMAWIDAQLKARQLDEDAKPYLAALMNELEKTFDGKVPESKLDRLARGSQPYRDYLTSMCAAWADAARRRVRYENLQMLLEARRSELAMEREKIAKGIYHQGP
jgi:hypothetical protein